MPLYKLVNFNKMGVPRVRIIENDDPNYSPDLSNFGKGAYIEPYPEKFEFESSSSDQKYTVTKLKEDYKCTCPGYWRSFTRECKHIKSIKNGNKK